MTVDTTEVEARFAALKSERQGILRQMEPLHDRLMAIAKEEHQLREQYWKLMGSWDSADL